MSISSPIGIITDTLDGNVTDSQYGFVSVKLPTMDADQSPFAKLIEERLKALNTNAFAVEQAHGLPEDAIRNVIRSQKKDGPTLARAKEICDALNLEFYVGTKRHTTIGFSEGQAEMAQSKPRVMVPIPWDSSVRSGDARSPVAFDQDWLLENLPHADDLVAVMPDNLEVEGWRTTATLVILDRSANKSKSLGLWCFVEAGKITAAKLQFDQGMIVIFPRDPQKHLRLLTGAQTTTIRLLGKVIWSGQIWD